MGHIGQRIFLLRIAQRAARPIGEARGLVQRLMRDLLDQRLVAHLFAKSADHGGHLRVEQWLGEHPAFYEEDFQILPGGMEHLHRRLVPEQVIERFHRHLGPLDGVDKHRLARLAGQGHLDQAQLRPVGAFPQKLGIDGDVRVILGRSAEGSQVGGRRYGLHEGPAIRGLRGHPAGSL